MATPKKESLTKKKPSTGFVPDFNNGSKVGNPPQVRLNFKAKDKYGKGNHEPSKTIVVTDRTKGMAVTGKPSPGAAGAALMSITRSSSSAYEHGAYENASDTIIHKAGS